MPSAIATTRSWKIPRGIFEISNLSNSSTVQRESEALGCFLLFFPSGPESAERKVLAGGFRSSADYANHASVHETRSAKVVHISICVCVCVPRPDRSLPTADSPLHTKRFNVLRAVCCVHNLRIEILGLGLGFWDKDSGPQPKLKAPA